MRCSIPCPRNEAATSVTIAANVVALMLSVPENAACSCEHPIVIGGSWRTGATSAMALPIATAIKVSVASGRCGPCCSNAPTGSTATRGSLTAESVLAVQGRTWCSAIDAASL